MWTYKQSTGEIFNPAGAVDGVGYAGRDQGWNNPAMQAAKETGPLPRGMYTVGNLEPQHGALGLFVMALSPDPSNLMFGRGSFFIHGRKSPTDLSASHGCIVQDRPCRLRIAASEDKRLNVIF